MNSSRKQVWLAFAVGMIAIAICVVVAISLSTRTSRALVDSGTAPASGRLTVTRLGVLSSPVLPPVLSRDGCHIAYATYVPGGVAVFRDGKTGRAYDGIGKGTLIFSPSGKHLAYGAKKGSKSLVVLDGKEGPQYDVIVPNGPTFRTDGTLEYLAGKNGVLFRVKHAPAVGK